MARTALSDDDLLEALAAGFDAGLSPDDVLATIARAGPAPARVARRLKDALPQRTLAAALSSLNGITPEEQTVIGLGEQAGRLPAALRWAAERVRDRREQRRSVRSAVTGPLVFVLLTFVTEPLLSWLIGTGSLWPMLRLVLFSAAAIAAALLIARRLPARASLGHRALGLARRLPFSSSLARLSDEARVAGVIAVFADARELGQSAKVVRAIALPRHADALDLVASDSLAPVSHVFSEPLALALALGARTGELASRAASFHRAAVLSVTARLRTIVRVLAYALLTVVALHAAAKLLSTSLPGMGGSFGNTPEMQELERELDNAGH